MNSHHPFAKVLFLNTTFTAMHPIGFGRFVLVVAALVFGTVVPALCQSTPSSEPRLALLMGVGDYRGTKFQTLPGIDKDLERMKAALAAAGFQVTVVEDPTLSIAEEAIETFGARLNTQAGGVGLFYFSGHGGEFEGTNYLIPKGARIGGIRDIKEQAVAAQRVLNCMEDAGARVNVVFLDCCRNDLTKAATDTGLAAMTAKGTFIGFATGTDKTSAASAEGSPYTTFLAKRLLTPGISILDMHTQVTADVEDFVKAQGFPAQTPFQYSGLRSRFAFVPDSKLLTTAPIEPPPPVQVSLPQATSQATAGKGDARALTRLQTRNPRTSYVAELEMRRDGKRIPLAGKTIVLSTQVKDGPLKLFQELVTDENGIIYISKSISKTAVRDTYLVLQFTGDDESRPCETRFRIR